MSSEQSNQCVICERLKKAKLKGCFHHQCPTLEEDLDSVVYNPHNGDKIFP